MHVSTNGLFVWALTILTILSLICGHFEIGISGGLEPGELLPESLGDTITTGFSWFIAAMSFQLIGTFGILSIIIWFVMVIGIFWPALKLIRGTD